MPRFMFALILAACAFPVLADETSTLRAWFSNPASSPGSVPSAVNRILSAGDVKSASERIWGAYREGAMAQGWEKILPTAVLSVKARGEISEAGKTMPFYVLARGSRGARGWPLIMSFHGGGQDTGPAPHHSAVNNGEWETQTSFAGSLYPEGLHFVPRMADDNDGRWYYSYNQAIYDRIIRAAILFRDVDPNRVYINGISEGGYVGYRIGAHMADRFAGSCSMAGAEPVSTSPPENFRNLPFRCAIGEHDTAYGRIGLARKYFARLRELREADGDSKAYVNFLEEQKGRGHGVDYAPCPAWVVGFTRNPWPAKVVWTIQPLHDVLRKQMYWLALDNVPENMPVSLSAEIKDNVISISAAQKARRKQKDLAMRIYLNDTLTDLNRPVTIVVNSKTVFHGTLKRSTRVLARSLAERGDPFFMFPAEVPLQIPVKEDTSPEPNPSNAVLLCSDAGFSGDCAALGPGRYDLADLGIPNDSLSSIKVPRGFRAILYEHGGFSGSQVRVEENRQFLGEFNDSASSIVVERLP